MNMSEIAQLAAQYDAENKAVNKGLERVSEDLHANNTPSSVVTGAEEFMLSIGDLFNMGSPEERAAYSKYLDERQSLAGRMETGDPNATRPSITADLPRYLPATAADIGLTYATGGLGALGSLYNKANTFGKIGLSALATGTAGTGQMYMQRDLMKEGGTDITTDTDPEALKSAFMMNTAIGAVPTAGVQTAKAIGDSRAAKAALDAKIKAEKTSQEIKQKIKDTEVFEPSEMVAGNNKDTFAKSGLYSDDNVIVFQIDENHRGVAFKNAQGNIEKKDIKVYDKNDNEVPDFNVDDYLHRIVNVDKLVNDTKKPGDILYGMDREEVFPKDIGPEDLYNIVGDVTADELRNNQKLLNQTSAKLKANGVNPVILKEMLLEADNAGYVNTGEKIIDLLNEKSTASEAKTNVGTTAHVNIGKLKKDIQKLNDDFISSENKRLDDEVANRQEEIRILKNELQSIKEKIKRNDPTQDVTALKASAEKRTQEIMDKNSALKELEKSNETTKMIAEQNMSKMLEDILDDTGKVNDAKLYEMVSKFEEDIRRTGEKATYKEISDAIMSDLRDKILDAEGSVVSRTKNTGTRVEQPRSNIRSVASMEAKDMMDIIKERRAKQKEDFIKSEAYTKTKAPKPMSPIKLDKFLDKAEYVAKEYKAKTLDDLYATQKKIKEDLNDFAAEIKRAEKEDFKVDPALIKEYKRRVEASKQIDKFIKGLEKKKKTTNRINKLETDIETPDTIETGKVSNAGKQAAARIKRVKDGISNMLRRNVFGEDFKDSFFQVVNKDVASAADKAGIRKELDRLGLSDTGNDILNIEKIVRKTLDDKIKNAKPSEVVKYQQEKNRIIGHMNAGSENIKDIIKNYNKALKTVEERKIFNKEYRQLNDLDSVDQILKDNKIIEQLINSSEHAGKATESAAYVTGVKSEIRQIFDQIRKEHATKTTDVDHFAISTRDGMSLKDDMLNGKKDINITDYIDDNSFLGRIINQTKNADDIKKGIDAEFKSLSRNKQIEVAKTNSTDLFIKNIFTNTFLKNENKIKHAYTAEHAYIDSIIKKIDSEYQTQSTINAFDNNKVAVGGTRPNSVLDQTRDVLIDKDWLFERNKQAAVDTNFNVILPDNKKSYDNLKRLFHEYAHMYFRTNSKLSLVKDEGMMDAFADLVLDRFVMNNEKYLTDRGFTDLSRQIDLSSQKSMAKEFGVGAAKELDLFEGHMVAIVNNPGKGAGKFINGIDLFDMPVTQNKQKLIKDAISKNYKYMGEAIKTIDEWIAESPTLHSIFANDDISKQAMRLESSKLKAVETQINAIQFEEFARISEKTKNMSQEERDLVGNLIYSGLHRIAGEGRMFTFDDMIAYLDNPDGIVKPISNDTLSTYSATKFAQDVSKQLHVELSRQNPNIAKIQKRIEVIKKRYGDNTKGKSEDITGSGDLEFATDDILEKQPYMKELAKLEDDLANIENGINNVVSDVYNTIIKTSKDKNWFKYDIERVVKDKKQKLGTSYLTGKDKVFVVNNSKDVVSNFQTIIKNYISKNDSKVFGKYNKDMNDLIKRTVEDTYEDLFIGGNRTSDHISTVLEGNIAVDRTKKFFGSLTKNKKLKLRQLLSKEQNNLQDIFELWSAQEKNMKDQGIYTNEFMANPINRVLEEGREFRVMSKSKAGKDAKHISDFGDGSIGLYTVPSQSAKIGNQDSLLINTRQQSTMVEIPGAYKNNKTGKIEFDNDFQTREFTSIKESDYEIRDGKVFLDVSKMKFAKDGSNLVVDINDLYTNNAVNIARKQYGTASNINFMKAMEDNRIISRERSGRFTDEYNFEGITYYIDKRYTHQFKGTPGIEVTNKVAVPLIKSFQGLRKFIKENVLTKRPAAYINSEISNNINLLLGTDMHLDKILGENKKSAKMLSSLARNIKDGNIEAAKKNPAFKFVYEYNGRQSLREDFRKINRVEPNEFLQMLSNAGDKAVVDDIINTNALSGSNVGDTLGNIFDLSEVRQKFTMYRNLLNKGVPHKRAMQEVQLAFPMYNENLSPMLAYVDEVAMFTKYAINVPKMINYFLNKNPRNTSSTLALIMLAPTISYMVFGETEYDQTMKDYGNTNLGFGYINLASKANIVPNFEMNIPNEKTVMNYTTGTPHITDVGISQRD